MINNMNIPVKLLKDEVWKQIPLKTNKPYYVSTRGRIYSAYSNRLIKGSLQSNKQRVVSFMLSEKEERKFKARRHKKWSERKYKRTNITLQRLIGMTFLNRNKRDALVLHKDFDKNNNDVRNLTWVGVKDYKNSWNKFRINKNNPNLHYAKLTEQDVRDIRKLFYDRKDLPSVKTVASQYGVSEMQIFRIKNGTCWNWAGGKIRKKKKIKRIDAKIIRSIKKELRSNKKSSIEIANKYGIADYTISRIKKGVYYKNVK